MSWPGQRSKKLALIRTQPLNRKSDSFFMVKPLKIAIFSLDPPASACALIRLLHPLQRLAGELAFRWAVEHDDRQFLWKRDAIAQADILVVQRMFPCTATSEWLQKMLAHGKPVVYETDDQVTDIPPDNPNYPFAQANRAVILDFIARANAVTVSTPPLADAIAAHNRNVHVIPNSLNERLWAVNRPARSGGPVTIGFTGTNTHQADLAIIEDALLTIAEQRRGQVAFVLMGCVTERLKALPNYTFHKFVPSYEEYARCLPRLGIDIAVIPLQTLKFNQAKSDIKWLEYSACGIPGIFTDFTPYQASIRNGETGLLVANNTESWVRALDQMIDEPESREAMAVAARKQVLSERTLLTGAGRHLHFFRSVLGLTGTP